MLPESTHLIAGRTYTVTRMTSAEQLECECLIAQMAGSAAVDVLVSAFEPLADALVDRARESMFRGGAFDLANVEGMLDRVLEDDTDGKMVESLIGVAFDALPPALVNSLRAGGASLASRVDWPKVSRLFELAVCGHVVVRMAKDAGEAVRHVRSLADLDAVTGRNPLAKWALLFASLRHTYAGALAEYREASAGGQAK